MASWKAGQNVFQLNRTPPFVCHFQCDWRCHVCQSQIHEWKMKTRVIHYWETNYMAQDIEEYYQYFICEFEEEWGKSKLTMKCLLELRWKCFIRLTCRSWFCGRCFVPVLHEHLQTPDSHVSYKGHRCSLTWRLRYCVSECAIDEGWSMGFWQLYLFSDRMPSLLCFRFELHLKFCNRC